MTTTPIHDDPMCTDLYVWHVTLGTGVILTVDKDDSQTLTVLAGQAGWDHVKRAELDKMINSLVSIRDWMDEH